MILVTDTCTTMEDSTLQVQRISMPYNSC